MKYYAVKAGRTTGIFMNWDDCKAQVDGYPGAKYKSFKNINDANNYMSASDAPVAKKAEPKTDVAELDCHDLINETDCVAYVDGSFNKAESKYGFGLVFLDLNGETKSHGMGTEPEMVAMRNVAGEIRGSMTAIEMAVKKGFSKIHIFYDYEGIEKWATGAWKTNKTDTKAYAEFCKAASIEIVFHKVDAHTGDYYNEMADQLAKRGAGVK